MEWLRRHRFAAGLLLVLVVALIGWQLLPDRSQSPTSATPDVATASPPTVETPSPPPSANVSVPAEEAADASAGALRGRAFDAITNEPVRRFEVTWREPIGEPKQQFDARRRTFETNDGSFEYTNVPPGKWGMIVTARGYQPFELPELKVTGGVAQEVLLPLQKGHTVRGRVYDQTTGAGIAATIEVLDPLAPMPSRSGGQADANAGGADGNFVIEGLPPGRTSLVVAAKNYTSRTVVVEVGASTPSLEIGLTAGGTITGRFTTAAGSPVAGASVTLYRPDGAVGDTRDTDDAGAFEFQDLNVGKYQLVGSHGSAIVTKDVTLSGRSVNVQLALKAGRSIRGTVTGLRPEQFGQVIVTGRRDRDVMWIQRGINERGEFELKDVSPGPVRVAAEMNRAREVSKSIEMPADFDVTVNLDFPPPATLSGRVTRKNMPLPDLTVAVRSTKPNSSSTSFDHHKTSSAGAYSVPDLEPGEYVVMVGSFISKPVQVQGQTVFNIDMPGGDLGGRVIDDGSGVPIARASVDLYIPDPTASVRINRLTDHLGQFTIPGIVPAEYVLAIYQPGYRLYRERISFDEQSAALTIRLPQERGVEIKCHDDAGRPVREIMVMETIDGQSGFVLNLSLDERGVGYLPSGLAGSKLQVIAPTGYLEIPSWNGAALDLRFAPPDKE
jgi:hypothetical protein